MILLRFLSVFILASCFFFSSCGKRHVQIDRETRRMIDTLSAHEINLLRPMMDSLCLQKMDSLIASMRDSVMMSRKEEMRKLLGK